MRHCYVVRVFTTGRAGGNALGVIPDATSLTSADMQEIATGLGFSETVFVDWQAGAVPALRIFTPAVELPFAGHPLVGTAWVLTELGPGADRMSIQIGEVTVRRQGDMVWVHPPAIHRPVRDEEVEAVGGVPVVGAWRVAVPSDFLLAEVASEGALVAASPDLAALASTADGVYLFCAGDPVRSRFFAPRLGVDEDPATGSAAVALAAVHRHRGEPAGTARIVQGRPAWLSEIHLTWNGPDTEIGGTTVMDELRMMER